MPPIAAHGFVELDGLERRHEDFDRVWCVFNTERLAPGPNSGHPDGTDVLLASNHPRVDTELFAAFREELGEPIGCHGKTGAAGRSRNCCFVGGMWRQ